MTFLPIIYFKVFLGLVFIEVSYFLELQNWLQKLGHVESLIFET